MMELTGKVEALLFASGDKLTIEEVAKLSRSTEQDALAALKELQQTYEKRESALAVFDDGEKLWKLTVKESYLPLVRKIVARTELSKSIMETLAVLAWKAPMKQSELVDIRSNKAYDHIKELEGADFITREPYGRTFMLKLTQKFFDYFELSDKKDIEKRFEKFDDFEKRIVPQRHVEDFSEEPSEEEKLQEIEEHKRRLSEEVISMRTSDKEFLTDIEGRISALRASSDVTTQEFASMLPSVEEEAGEEEGVREDGVKEDGVEAEDDDDVSITENQLDEEEQVDVVTNEAEMSAGATPNSEEQRDKR